MAPLPRTVTVMEVGPRDGLQNEAVRISTEDKIAFVNRLSASGLREIEVSSFVSPKWIPQLDDARDQPNDGWDNHQIPKSGEQTVGGR